MGWLQFKVGLEKAINDFEKAKAISREETKEGNSMFTNFGYCPHCTKKVSVVATKCPHCTANL
jgi:hypothetical protein